MRTAMGARRLDTPGDAKRRWFPGFFITLPCAALIVLAAFALLQPAEVSIRPTAPMPDVNVP
ncbi:hypothetical protein JQ617_27795 [Bradyrhizobium sp. KB893862 SZCCT0404]|uniref:hypothetical protein n=1 Tax=Bradyrhizobium sp. KB893862 SZCCT0404 TaxID=2807672 RepID=UPI001BAA746A|nr:hypothetical protein [Bradyrhizobium sp. KB893862 SZCCT0404]MBR1177792.1 hypothetical protein [Bradyrhizobium sp. KB893862 SZCCT0404]